MNHLHRPAKSDTLVPKSIFLLLASSLIASMSFSACHQVGDSVSGAIQDGQKSSQVVQTKHDVSSQAMLADIQTLMDYEWVLVKAQKQGADIQTLSSVINQKQSILRFDEQNISYSLGCNTYAGDYQLTQGKLTLGAMMSTQMFCDDLSSIENKFHQRLQNSVLTITKDSHGETATLTQTNGAEILTWQGKLTPTAKFGDPVLLFWEIQPQTVYCVDKQGHNQQCLQVRNVHYDELGIKTGAGAWRNFYGQIEGYQHDSSLRQIIRIKAFNHPKPHHEPVYLFDMAVETELVK